VRSILVPEQGPIQTASLGLAGPLAAIDFLHPLLGLIIAIYTWLFGFSLLKRGNNLSGLIKKFTVAMMILMLAQLIAGAVLITTGIPGLIQIFHLWIASFYIGIMIYIHSAYNKTRRLANAKAQ
jgi:heme A synthase